MSEEEPVKYYNLTIFGLGYANRARYVTSREGRPRLHVDISALTGRQSNIQYRKFQTRVVTDEAEEIIQRFESQINTDTDRVLVGFKISDANPASYETDAGERRHFCYAYLLNIMWVRVNGEQVYKIPAATEPEYPDDIPF